MGLGGYLAARGDAEHYASERAREEREIAEIPEAEVAEVTKVFTTYGLSPADSAKIAETLRVQPKAWVEFMMRFELGVEEPDPKRALTSPLTIAGAYIVGGFFPLTPYILVASAQTSLLTSVAVTLMALLVFGYIKGQFTGTRPLRSAIQTMLIGGVAAAVAFGIAHAIS